MRAGPLVRGGRREASTKLGDKLRERLRAAYALADRGASAEAAAELGEVAGIASGRGLNRIAVHVGVRAALHAARANDLDAARNWATAAIAAAKAEGDKARSARAFGLLIRGLRADHPAVAEELAQQVRAGVGIAAKEEAGEAPKVNRAMRRHLPKACPTCDAPVDPEQVAFNEDASVDCPVCGDVLKV